MVIFVTKLFFQTFLLDNPLTPFNKGERKVPLIKGGQGGCIKRNNWKRKVPS